MGRKSNPKIGNSLDKHRQSGWRYLSKKIAGEVFVMKKIGLRNGVTTLFCNAVEKS